MVGEGLEKIEMGANIDAEKNLPRHVSRLGQFESPFCAQMYAVSVLGTTLLMSDCFCRKYGGASAQG